MCPFFMISPMHKSIMHGVGETDFFLIYTVLLKKLKDVFLFLNTPTFFYRRMGMQGTSLIFL